MGVFEAAVPSKPSPEQGAIRVKRSLAQAFQQVELALGQVRQIMDRHGADKIQSALGNDQVEVVRLYGALKGLVEQHKPNSTIPDLPKSFPTR